jgi:glycosyltransferase involved in cell wall biosynthesis
MSASPLTILQLTFQGDGAGSTRSIVSLSEYLARRGHRVLVGCRAESVLAGLADHAGLDVVRLDFRRLGPLARTLAAIVLRERVDVINSHATRDRRALTWLRWRRRLAPAFVVTRRTMPLTSSLELVAVGLSADRTIAVSGAVARALARRRHPLDRIRVVPNGIDLARVDAPVTASALASARAALGDIGERRVVVVVSRRKDQDVLLRALPQVDAPLLLACVGIEADRELAALTAGLPARHRVVCVPFVPQPLVFYHLASAAVLPSRIEGLSQALLEAMALGLPVAASDAGGNPDLITHDATGWLVPARDVAAWARALHRLAVDGEATAALAAAGRTLVRREFTLERTTDRTEVVYREALARRTRLLAGDAPM